VSTVDVVGLVPGGTDYELRVLGTEFLVPSTVYWQQRSTVGFHLIHIEQQTWYLHAYIIVYTASQSRKKEIVSGTASDISSRRDRRHQKNRHEHGP